ncbi:MAG: TM0106 family RecB-like putative nuclease [Xenococcus sp. (in: cyanobacteria)]
MLTITSEIIIAYSQCPYKAYLLLFEKEQGIAVEYIEILEKREQSHRETCLNKIPTISSEITLSQAQELKYFGSSISKVILKFQEFQAECDLLCIEQVEEENINHLYYEPIIFTGTYSVTKEQKLKLFFIGYLLQNILKIPINKGKIISLDNHYHTVKLHDNFKLIKPLINPIEEWIKTSSSEPPPVILNKHCPYCQFQVNCRIKAEQDNDLSLLASMTAKSWQKYHKRGIFTVKQLSYLYRPKKRRKNPKNTFSRHKPELQALAIRTGKIYLQHTPVLIRQKVEIFLDIEGIPDQKFYYLIGLLICVRGQVSYTSFWADNVEQEEEIWLQLMEIVNLYPEAPIYHYGSYESKAIKKLSKNYSDKDNYKNIEERLINVNQYIYGKVYFPAYSNSLKELGKYVGASWSKNLSSGLESLVDRYRWEEEPNTKIKQILINYNREDCQALKLLTDLISSLNEIAKTHDNIDFVDQPKKIHTKKGKLVHRQFEIILETAHQDYDKNKISLRSLNNKKTFQKRKNCKSSKGYKTSKQLLVKFLEPDISVEVKSLDCCPIHLTKLTISKHLKSKTIIDLIFQENSITKTIIRYFGSKSYCSECNSYYSPPAFSNFHNGQIYGRGF